MAIAASGARLIPTSGPVRGLVILLHGYGSSGMSLLRRIEPVARWLPQLALVALDGPHRTHAGGRSWFDLRSHEPAAMFRAAEEVRPQLDQSIDTEQGGLGLTDDAIALVGASQGGAMALHLGLRRQRPVRQIVTFAGFLLSDPQETAILSFPPVTMIHGDRDTVVPIEVMQRSATALERMGVPVTTIVATGAGHVLPPENIAVGINAVLEAFGTD